MFRCACLPSSPSRGGETYIHSILYPDPGSVSLCEETGRPGRVYRVQHGRAHQPLKVELEKAGSDPAQEAL